MVDILRVYSNKDASLFGVWHVGEDTRFSRYLFEKCPISSRIGQSPKGERFAPNRDKSSQVAPPWQGEGLSGPGGTVCLLRGPLRNDEGQNGTGEGLRRRCSPPVHSIPPVEFIPFVNFFFFCSPDLSTSGEGRKGLASRPGEDGMERRRARDGPGERTRGAGLGRWGGFVHVNCRCIRACRVFRS